MLCPPTGWRLMASPGSGAIAALLLLTAASVANAEAFPDVKIPYGMQTAMVSSRMVYNGNEMQDQIFTVKTSVADTLAFYRQLWGKASVVTSFNGAQIVAHKQGGYFITVEIRQDGSGSKGTIGVLKLPTGNEKPQLGSGVPVPENSAVFNDIQYPDDATPARTIALRNMLSLRQNASYYREHLIGSGWKPTPMDTCTDASASCVMDFENGDKKITLALTSQGSTSRVVINMLGPGVTQ